MTGEELDELCEQGQRQLMEMEYLAAEATLARAEREALAAREWDVLARLYLPLQEARRQRRQRCGEGIVCLDLIARDADDRLDGREIVERFPHGQLLVAGWGSIEPALQVRRAQAERGLYVETFLAAAYPIGAGRAIAIVPLDDVRLPPPAPRSVDELISNLPAHSIILNESELPRGERRGTFETYAEVMALWERLHAPFLAAADMQVDPVQKIEAYRKTIRIDYACELAHQKLSDVAKQLARS